MNSSNLIKIAAAFLIGVVATLGSALLYLRTTDVAEKPPPAVLVAPEPAPKAEPEAAPTPPATDKPAPVQAKSTPQAKPERRPKPVGPLRPKATAKEPITVAAQNNPPPIASPAPTPTKSSGPAINEPSPGAPMPNDPAPEPSTPPADPNPVAQPHVVTLQAGTNLTVRLGETISSDHNYTGDTFRGTLATPVIINGFIIADRGSKVLGKVINVQAAGRVQGVSGLILALTEISTTDGQRVRVQTNSYEKRGSTNIGSEAAKIAGGAALGAIIGAIAGGGKGAAIGAGAGGAAGTGIVLATRGKPTAVPVETQLDFRLTSPVTITEQINK